MVQQAATLLTFAAGLFGTGLHYIHEVSSATKEAAYLCELASRLVPAESADCKREEIFLPSTPWTFLVGLVFTGVLIGVFIGHYFWPIIRVETVVETRIVEAAAAPDAQRFSIADQKPTRALSSQGVDSNYLIRGGSVYVPWQ